MCVDGAKIRNQPLGRRAATMLATSAPSPECFQSRSYLAREPSPSGELSCRRRNQIRNCRSSRCNSDWCSQRFGHTRSQVRRRMVNRCSWDYRSSRAARSSLRSWHQVSHDASDGEISCRLLRRDSTIASAMSTTISVTPKDG